MSSGGDSFGTVRLTAGPVLSGSVLALRLRCRGLLLSAFVLTMSVRCWRTPLNAIVSILSPKLSGNPPLKGHHGASFGP